MTSLNIMKLPFKKALSSSLYISVLVSLLVSICIIEIRNKKGFEFLELAAYDYYLRLRTEEHLSTVNRIVLITVSEEDIHKQRQWPLSDYTLSSLIEIIENNNPRVIGLDIFRDIPVQPGSKQLVEVFSRFKNIISVKKMGDDKLNGIPQPFMISNMDMVGFNDVLVDTGGIVRRGLLFLDDGGITSYSFPLLLAILYLREEGISPQPGADNLEHLRLGKTTFVPFESNDGGYVGADARGYQFLIDFKDMKTPFQSFSLTDVLSGRIPEEAIKNKIVIIGISAVSIKDFLYTPLSQGMRFDQRMPGIELHARIVSQLLRSAIEGDKPIGYLKEKNEWLWILLWGMIGGLLGLLGRSLWRYFSLAIISIFVLIVLTHYAFILGWWIPLVPPAAAWLLSNTIISAYYSFKEKQQKTLLMYLFSRHVSQKVAETIWQQRKQFIHGGRPHPQKLIATVLFSDLKGFTAIAEKLNPQELIDWLNEYMDAMSKIIMKHGGVINKYIGDSIMAIFGVPVARTNDTEISKDAINAVNCAIAMSDMLQALNKYWKEKKMPTVKMRIGINTGPLIAGSIGSAQRIEYTVLGDTVNIASRLESFDKDSFDLKTEEKDSTCRVLIGEETLKYLNQQFKTNKFGTVSLRGKKEKITIYVVTENS